MRTAEIGQDDFKRREARALVLEEIEDFEHKLGWRMRSRLGDNVFLFSTLEQHKLEASVLSLFLFQARFPSDPFVILLLMRRALPDDKHVMRTQDRTGSK